MSSRYASVALLVLAMASIQSGASLAKRLFPIVGPEGATALRLCLAALILLIVWHPWRKPLTRPRLAAIAVYGAMLGLMNLLFYKALETIPLGVAVALEFTGPLGLALIGSRRPRDLVWVALAVGGVVALSPMAPGGEALDWTGAAFALAAGLAWAIYIIFGKQVGGGDRGQAISLGMLTAALVGAPIGIAEAGAGLLVPQILAIGLALALLSSIIPYSLELTALNRLPTRTFGILMSLEPAVAALAGLAFLSERLGPLQWLGIAAVITASAGAAATSEPMSEPAPT